MHTYRIHVRGYWRDKYINLLPEEEGIFFVFETSFNEKHNTVSLKQLLYIGESDNIQAGIRDYEQKEDWIKRVSEDNELCYAVALHDEDRLRVAASLIYEHKPPCNFEYTFTLPFELTSVHVEGDVGFLSSFFIA